MEEKHHLDSGGKGRGESASTTHTPVPPSPTFVLSDPVIPSLSTVTGVAQLEALLRVNIMMSRLHGVGTQEHWDLTLAAVAYCSLIWKVLAYYSNSSLT